MRRLFSILLLLAPGLPGYYHYTHYNSRTGPYVAIREKFDLSAVYNKTVPFYIADLGPTQMVSLDSFPALVSQIRAAAKVWNDVATSDLRFTYGGLYSQGTTENSPGVDVVFSDDLPPGLVALTVNTTKSAADSTGTFVPITRSTVMFPKDLTSRPAYTEAFFLTAVHEFGHALGLQHTLTSSALSTEVTRGTSKARPLTADDIAGISVLYPAKDFLASTGVVSGRVVMEGSGVSLASVVLLTPSGPVISSLTNPDGTFRIEGIPTGQYYLYAHPLPPALSPGETSPANITPPKGPDGQFLSFGPAFDLQFYPGTTDVQQAFPISVNPGSSQDGLNFTVNRRTRQTLYAVQTFGFPGDTPVKPPFLSVDIARPYIVAAGYGLVANGAPTPGLKASVIGGSATVASDGIKSYPYSSAYVQMNVLFNPLAGDGPRHLLFSLNGESYVLPTAFQVVQKAPPSITGVVPGLDAAGNRIATLSGTGFTLGTRFLFDGQAVAVRSYDDAGQKAIVAVPGAAPGSRSVVTAYNADGQSSLFLETKSPPVYTYDAGQSSNFVVTPSVLPAGVRTVVQVDGVNTNFVDGQVTIGFGTSDILVEKAWVVSPTQILANVAVAPNAVSGLSLASVTSGLRILSQPFAFQVQPPVARNLELGPAILNAATGQPGLSPGAVATVTLSMTSSSAQPVVTLNDKPVSVVSYQPGQLTFQIPANQPVGPAVLKVQIGPDAAPAVVIGIDPQPPTVVAVSAGQDNTIDPNHPAHPGDVLTVTLAGLSDSTSAGTVLITVGGVDFSAVQTGSQQYQFMLPSTAASGQSYLTVSVNGHVSLPYPLAIRSN